MVIIDICISRRGLGVMDTIIISEKIISLRPMCRLFYSELTTLLVSRNILIVALVADTTIRLHMVEEEYLKDYLWTISWIIMQTPRNIVIDISVRAQKIERLLLLIIIIIIIMIQMRATCINTVIWTICSIYHIQQLIHLQHKMRSTVGDWLESS